MRRLNVCIACQQRSMPPKVIIDTDCGVDDAQALLIALTRPESEVEVLGISCVTGNVQLSRVVQNVKRVQLAVGTNVPIYKGASMPIIGPSGVNASFWHGLDGLGNSGFQDVPEGDICCGNFVNGNAAVNIVRLAHEFPKEISIVALGPLTNIALALLLEPSLPDLVKELWWMGGSRSGVGNVTKSAEFNAYGDPEALKLVVSSFPLVHCLDWQATLDHGLEFEWFEQLLEAHDSPHSIFLKRISSMLITQSKESEYSHYGFLIPDPLCMIAFLFEESRRAFLDAHVEIELTGIHTRGMTVVEISSGKKDASGWPVAGRNGTKCNVRFYSELDMECVKQAFKNIV